METWFIPHPETRSVDRAVLRLGLGRADRWYRELSVPGIGGAWFVRELSWAAAALSLSRGFPRERATSIAHAIEALGCKSQWLTGDEAVPPGWLRGVRAFDRHPEALSYRELCRRRHYVQVTYRQNITGSLPEETGLGFSRRSTRFNAMQLTAHGEDLAEAVLAKPAGQGRGRTEGWLRKWIAEEPTPPTRWETLARAIGPWRGTAGGAPDEEGALVLTRLRSVNRPLARVDQHARVRLLDVLGALRIPADEEEPGFEELLAMLGERGAQAHGHALQVAAAFQTMQTALRDVIHTVAGVLDEEGQRAASAEALMRSSHVLERRLEMSKSTISDYATLASRHGLDHGEARSLVVEMSDMTGPALLRATVARDEAILAPGPGGSIQAGPLFESRDPDRVGLLPSGLVLPRLRNLWSLWRDCHAGNG